MKHIFLTMLLSAFFITANAQSYPSNSKTQANRIKPITIAIVTDNKHPDGHYKVKVKFPWIPSKSPYTFWARVSFPGPAAGFDNYLLPEVGDEVVITFAQGDFRQPVVIGSLWNDSDRPPTEDDPDPE